MTESIEMSSEEFIGGIPEQIKDAPISPQMGIAGLAMSLALKYHDINTVQEGALYQQYKLEGKNLQGLHLDHVFETAARIERHLLETPSRLALCVLNAVAKDIEEVLDEAVEPKPKVEEDGGDGNYK